MPRAKERAKTEKDVRSMARSHTAMAVRSLVQVAAKGKSESARVAASTAILDRGWGRPEQHTQIDVRHDVTAFLREIQGAVIDAQAESLDDQGMQLEHSPDADMVLEASADYMADD